MSTLVVGWRVRLDSVHLRYCAAMALLVFLMAAGRASAQTPEKPEEPYWLRNPSGVGPEQGTMDPRAEQLASAYGTGRYAEARRLAEGTLASAADADLAAQAASYLVESYLAEGSFRRARESAGGTPAITPQLRHALLARVTREERLHQAEVSHLERTAATAKDPAEAARALFWLGHRHRQAGCTDLAERAYRAVAEQWPQAPEAPLALAQVADIQRQSGRNDAAQQSCWAIIERFPNGSRVSGAVLRIGVWSRQDNDEDGATAAWDRMIELVPDSLAAVTAADCLFDTFLAEQPLDRERAIQRMSEIAARHPATAVGREARTKLASLRLQKALRERESRSYLAAAQELEVALAEGDLAPGDRFTALNNLALCYQATDQLARAIARFREAEATDAAAARSAGVAYQIAVCHYRLRDFRLARDEFNAVLRDDPQGPLAGYAEERVRQCEELIAAQQAEQ